MQTSTDTILFDDQEFDKHAARAVAADSCRALWYAVLIQAVRDVSRVPTGLSGGGARVAAHEADSFLRGRGGHLREVCDMVGIDPGKVTDLYLRGLLRIDAMTIRGRRESGTVCRGDGA